jgi:hypothetical protein
MPLTLKKTPDVTWVRYGIALISALTRAVCSRDWHLICGWDWQRSEPFLRLLEDKEALYQNFVERKSL